ncbi:MAG TPA: hypothetical protein VGF45_00585 [Polyangia bacterium]
MSAPSASTPRWVKVFGLVTLVVVVAVVVVHLTVGGLGNHGSVPSLPAGATSR